GNPYFTKMSCRCREKIWIQQNTFVMRLGARIRESRMKKGLTQAELAEQSGLTERTIQRIENHDTEPSNHSLKKLGEVLNENFNEKKLNDMKKKQRLLQIVIVSITLLIAVLFFIGIFTIEKDWWVLAAWLVPIFGGISIPYYKRSK
ncbi:MAG: helix-turn-helix domain-containing protein, partial [Bacteroidota bacterium]